MNEDFLKQRRSIVHLCDAEYVSPTYTTFQTVVYQILHDSGVEMARAPDIVTSLEAYYNLPRRWYHNVDHILDMIGKAYKFEWTAPCLLVAVLFHDCIYTPGTPRGQSEMLSAHQLGKCLPHMKAVCEPIVLATTEFMTRHSDFSIDQKRISDLDLSSIARPDWEGFCDQQQRIAAEFNGELPLKPSLCLAHSASFLKQLLDSRGGQLFYTDQARDLWEQQGRRNIERLCTEYL